MNRGGAELGVPHPLLEHVQRDPVDRRVDAKSIAKALGAAMRGIGDRGTYPHEGSGARFHRRRRNGIFLPSQSSAPVPFRLEDNSHSDQRRGTLTAARLTERPSP